MILVAVNKYIVCSKVEKQWTWILAKQNCCCLFVMPVVSIGIDIPFVMVTILFCINGYHLLSLFFNCFVNVVQRVNKVTDFNFFFLGVEIWSLIFTRLQIQSKKRYIFLWILNLNYWNLDVFVSLVFISSWLSYVNAYL